MEGVYSRSVIHSYVLIQISGQPYNKRMGQINCQCQEPVLLEHELNYDQHNQLLQTLSHSPSQPLQTCTRLALHSHHQALHIDIPTTSTLTFGTSSDCQQRYMPISQESQFKVEVRVVSRAVMVRDCGVGLGAFLLKKKFSLKRLQETFLSIGDYFVLLTLGANKLSWRVFDILGQQSFEADIEKEMELQIKDSCFIIRSQKEGEEYFLKRKDRKGILCLLVQEQRVRTRDVLRLGCQFYEVSTLSMKVEEESSTIEVRSGR